MKRTGIFFLLVVVQLSLKAQPADFEFNPRKYICYRSNEKLKIDGNLNETAWQKAPFTSYFVDIEGEKKTKPLHKTRAKMLWDDSCLYIAAVLDEPHLWATITRDESVIYYDNDFEIFIDPDGDTHFYYEFEINALGTKWDLLLSRPYRDGAYVINAWQIRNIQAEVTLAGSLNNPTDLDTNWTIEVAMPWSVLRECTPTKRRPRVGEQWRINFSRVQWQHQIENGQYTKKINPNTGKSYPEYNWVWSPQGVIDMHRPETWGFVQFSGHIAGKAESALIPDPDEKIKWKLRKIYYKQRQYHKKHGKYASKLKQLKAKEIKANNSGFSPKMRTTQSLYEITMPSADKKYIWHIDQSGRTWKTTR